MKNYFSTRWGIIGVGAFIGVIAALLQKLGNPGNMGICVACFERDIAGAIGLHRAGVVQYMRPEIIGFVLGSLVAAYLFKEFRPRTGSAPIVRFVLGVFAMIGALVFWDARGGHCCGLPPVTPMPFSVCSGSQGGSGSARCFSKGGTTWGVPKKPILPWGGCCR